MDEIERMQGSVEYDSDCEYEGSFIILPTQKSTNLQNNSLNMNVHELGQLQSSAEILQEQLGSTTISQEETKVDNAEKVANEIEAVPPNTDTVQDKFEEEMISDCAASMLSGSFDSFTNSALAEANRKIFKLLEEKSGFIEFARESNEKQKRFLENIEKLQQAVNKSKLEAEEHGRKYERSAYVIESLRTKVANLEQKLTMEAEKNKGEENSDFQIKRLQREVDEKEILLKDANTQLVELKEIVRSLGNELSQARASITIVEDNSSLLKERDLLSIAFEESKHTINKLNERYIMQEQNLNRVVEELAELKLELKEQESEISKLLKDLDEANVQHEIDLKNIAAAVNDKKSLDHNINRLSTEYADALQNNFQITEQMNSKEEALLQLDDEFTKVNHDLRAKSAQLEVYRTQMEEYKSNFEEERQEKIRIKEQKDRIADELLRVQMELEQIRITSPNNRTSSTDVKGNPLTDFFVNAANSIKETFGPNRNAGEGNRDVGGTSRANEEVSAVPLSSEASVGNGNAENAGNIQQSYSCPICQKKYKNSVYLITHAATCGDEPQRRVDSFAFP